MGHTHHAGYLRKLELCLTRGIGSETEVLYLMVPYGSSENSTATLIDTLTKVSLQLDAALPLESFCGEALKHFAVAVAQTSSLIELHRQPIHDQICQYHFSKDSLDLHRALGYKTISPFVELMVMLSGSRTGS